MSTIIKSAVILIALLLVAFTTSCNPSVHELPPEATFEGRHFSGRGDVEYLKLLEFSRRVLGPDAEFQNLSMLYDPTYNGLTEGSMWWGAWWIQNSYGTTYSALPLLAEPFVTFIQKSQDLWFDQMGDGIRVGLNGEIGPVGALCDAAAPGWVAYKQGDGPMNIHDWGFEFTAAGILLQAELLLINRDADAIAHYLPKLERAADFIDSRRDPGNHLFLVGPSANLLGPSYAGWKKPDGTYDNAYLAGMSVTTIAALDRLVELEKLAGRKEMAEEYSRRRELVRSGLPLLQTEEGYFIKSLDPDGTRHGVFGSGQHGYFEASPNHDAIAFRVVSDEQARAIYNKLAAIPQIRPYDLILANYPSLDDMYATPEGVWGFGQWVNGGHWSTCEGRMVLAYYRLGRFEDASRSVKRMLGFAQRFQMDNPLTKFGSEVFFPLQPTNLTYDAFAPMAAFVRGLFEYVYSADTLTLYPQIPPRVTELHQNDPVRFGTKKLLLSTYGAGPVSTVLVNGQPWANMDATSVTIPYDEMPGEARVEIYLGSARPGPASPRRVSRPARVSPSVASNTTAAAPGPVLTAELINLETRFVAFQKLLSLSGLNASYEAAHARVFLEAVEACRTRQALLSDGSIPALPSASETAADNSYVETSLRLGRGLDTVLMSYENSLDARKSQIYGIYLRLRDVAVASATLSVDPASPQLPGTRVNFTGSATGGSGMYEYQFLGRAAGSSTWSVSQAYGPNPTWTWTGVTGSWEVRVNVRNAGSTVEFDRFATIGYVVE